MSYLKYDGSVAVETVSSTNFLGTSALETISGGAGADGLAGSDGDVLAGGAGADTYYLQGANITVTEGAGAGVDKIVGWANVNLASYANVENLEIGGGKTYGAGNTLDNIVVATGTHQEVYGGGGQDVLVGSASGPTTFIVVKGEGNDAIYNFAPSHDVIRLTAGYTSFGDLQQHMTQAGSDVKVDLGGADALVLRDVSLGQLTAANFQLQLATGKLGALTFQDEFAGPLSLYNATYNPNGVWRPDYDLAGSQGTSTYTLTSNGEQQIYTSPYFRDHAGDFGESPFTSNPDGTLSIWAKPSSNSEIFGYHYTSGMISTLSTFAQTYGYFEMRAELPQTAGGWPAFWLLPTDRTWPPELDVMEVLTKDANATWTTQHSNASGGHSMDQGVEFTPDTTDGFHTYGLLWTKTDLAWYVDGVEVFHSATPADLNKPMYMIANLALGGWGGDVNGAQMPAQMKIDYIRAYGLADGTSTVSLDKVHSGGGSAAAGASSGGTGGATTGASASGASGSAGVGVAAPSGPQVLTAAGTGSVLAGGDGADTLNASVGLDTLTGGAGADRFTFANEPWAPDHITDFQVGVDVLDMSALFSRYGYHGTNPVADGWVTLESDGAGGTMVGFDHDGPGGSSPQWPNRIIDLEHVSPTGLTWAQLQGSGVSSSPGSSSSSGTGGSAAAGSAAAPIGGASAGGPSAVATPASVGSSSVAASAGGGGGGGGGGPVNTVSAGGSVLHMGSGGGVLDGAEGNDSIYASDSGPNYIRGFAGDDQITGSRSYNEINGNIGNDTISGRSEVGDSIMGGQGNDVISTSSSVAHNKVNGNRGDDTITGGGHGDTLWGGQGDDQITGGSGNDWISGDKGNDTVSGGGGGDIFHHFAGAGVTIVTDFNFAEGDRVQLNLGDTAYAHQIGADTVIDLEGGGEMILRDVRLTNLSDGWLFTA